MSFDRVEGKQVCALFLTVFLVQDAVTWQRYLPQVAGGWTPSYQ